MGGFRIQTHKELTNVESRQDSALGIMKWGTDNSFPQTLINLINQSPVARPAVQRTAKFYRGGNFEGQDQIVSALGLTLKDVVSIMADDLAYLEGFALHSNFNIEGKTVSINPMRVAELRFNVFDELNHSSKLGYHPNFGRNAVEQKTIVNMPTRGRIKWVDRFNPNMVLQQISETEGGLGNYNGQILYHSESGNSAYPIPPLQAPVNYVLADIENSILIRKETSTGFIQSYLLKTTLSAEDANLIALEEAIIEAQGARGTGKVITMPGMTPEMVNSTILEEIAGGKNTGIIDSATKGFELASKVILGAYLIPPILGGADVSTGFSTENLKDAYFIFNSVTQPGRDVIEQKINRVLANSTFDIKHIELQPLTLDLEGEEEEGTTMKITDFLAAYVSKREKESGTVPEPLELLSVVKAFVANKEGKNE